MDLTELNEESYQESFTNPSEETGQIVKNKYLQRGPDGTHLDMHVIK